MESTAVEESDFGWIEFKDKNVEEQQNIEGMQEVHAEMLRKMLLMNNDQKEEGEATEEETERQAIDKLKNGWSMSG